MCKPACHESVGRNERAGRLERWFGAAVAGGQGAASIGTDCACSVRNPAALNGISGIRPTHGRVSTTGVVPVSLGMDTVGPLCRTVEDTAILLSVMSGHDPTDRSTSTAPVPDWASDITQPMDGLTLGVPTNFFFDHMEPGVQAAVEGAVATFQDLGLKVREIEIPHAHWAGDAFFVMCLVETAVLHDDWLHIRASEFGMDLRAAAELGISSSQRTMCVRSRSARSSSVSGSRRLRTSILLLSQRAPQPRRRSEITRDMSMLNIRTGM